LGIGERLLNAPALLGDVGGVDRGVGVLLRDLLQNERVVRLRLVGREKQLQRPRRVMRLLGRETVRNQRGGIARGHRPREQQQDREETAARGAHGLRNR